MAANRPEPDKLAKDQLKAVAEAVRFLLRFPDRELEADFLFELVKYPVEDWLGIEFESDTSKKAVTDLDAALSDLPTSIEQDLIDILAAEYANIYLNHNYRVSPSGSVWLTEEGLERQEPMFEARKWYKKYGLEAPDWRLRADDHIVHELQFVAFLLERGDSKSLEDAVRFMDENVLNWVPEFGKVVAERCQQPIYGASALLIGGLVEELRDLLEEITGIARPVVEEQTPQDRITLYEADIERPYVPGVGEGW